MSERGKVAESPIKKELLKKLEKNAIKKKLRADLPVLNAREIRKHRLPYHEAILADLHDIEFDSSAEFISQLIKLQEDTRQRYGPGTLFYLRPRLMDSRRDLDILFFALCRAEKAHNQNDFVTEWDELLKLACKYAFGPEDWWWLGEQLLYQCITIAYPKSFEKYKALSNYIYGKYLVENSRHLENGRYYLEKAREIAIGKSWNCKKMLPNQKQDTIFIESCLLVHSALIEEVKLCMNTNPIKAIDLSILARKRAAEACHYLGEFHSLVLKGKCEMLIQEPTEAIVTFTKALTIATRKKSAEAICEAKIQLALAYLGHHKGPEALKSLKEMKKMAEDNNMPFYLAQAYRYMGEYYLNQERPRLATPLLIIAFYIFRLNNFISYREKVRTLAAISAGEELFPTYINIIKNVSDPEHGQQNLATLLKWKDQREVFWTEDISKFTFNVDNSIYDQIISEEGSSHEEAHTSKNSLVLKTSKNSLTTMITPPSGGSELNMEFASIKEDEMSENSEAQETNEG